MNRLSSVALSAALVIAGVGASVSAEARPYVDHPGGGVIEPVGHSGHYYGHDRYWHHEFGWDRHDRFHRGRWDRR
jgi:hypothetical protein